MSFRSLHHSRAAKQIEAAASIVELAKLEKEELEGGEHRPSLRDEFTSRTKSLLSAGFTEDQHVEVLEILDGKTGSILIAALEGDSHSDDGTGPGETREGGESPSEAADPKTQIGTAASVAAPAPEPKPSPKPRAKATSGPTKIVGRLVRVRQPDGGHVVMGLADARRRRR